MVDKVVVRVFRHVTHVINRLISGRGLCNPDSGQAGLWSIEWFRHRLTAAV